MSEIFINYRRDDTSGHAIHITQHLAKKFGSDNIFLDMGIKPLENWQESIETALQKTKILIVLIGKRWLIDRLYQKDDYVSKEIVWALERKIEILPVLVDGTSAPGLYSVPVEIQLLTQVQMLQLSNINSDQYIRDLDELSYQVEKRLLGSRTKGYVSNDMVMFVFCRSKNDSMRVESILINIMYGNLQKVAFSSIYCGQNCKIFLPPSAYSLQPYVDKRGTHYKYDPPRKYTGQQLVSKWKPGAYYFEVGHITDWKVWVPLYNFSSSDRLFLRNTHYEPWTYQKFLNSFSTDLMDISFYELTKIYIQHIDKDRLRNDI